MNESTLNYLSVLRPFFAQVSALASESPTLAAQASIYGQLVDHMYIQLSVLPLLKKETLILLNKALQILEGQFERYVTASDHTVADEVAIRELVLQVITLTESGDPLHFDQCLQRLVRLQNKLLFVDDQGVTQCAKSLVSIEAEYSSKVLKAVREQTALAEQNISDESEAWNTRHYNESDLRDFIVSSFADEIGLNIEESGFISGGFSKFTVGLKVSANKSLPSELILRGDAGDAFGGASVTEEYSLLKTLYKLGVNVVEPLALEKSGKVFGSPFMLMAKKPGELIGHMFNLPGPNSKLCGDIAAALASIHKIPLDVLDGKLSGSTDRSSDKISAWLDESYSAWQPLNLSSAVFETAFSWLRENVAINDTVDRALVHGDFGLNNLLIHQGEISSILDWEFAHIGNPAYDLGYFYFMAEDMGSWDQFLQAYQQAGCDVPSESQLNYHILLAATRLGVMACQAEVAFSSGLQTGLSGMAVTSGHFSDRSIERIAGVLDRVL